MYCYNLLWHLCKFFCVLAFSCIFVFTYCFSHCLPFFIQLLSHYYCFLYISRTVSLNLRFMCFSQWNIKREIRSKLSVGNITSQHFTIWWQFDNLMRRSGQLTPGRVKRKGVYLWFECGPCTTSRFYWVRAVLSFDSALCHRTSYKSPLISLLRVKMCLLMHSKCQILPNKSQSLFFFHTNPLLIDTALSSSWFQLSVCSFSFDRGMPYIARVDGDKMNYAQRKNRLSKWLVFI